MLRQPEAWKESRKNKIWEEKLPKRAGRFLAMRNFGQTHTNTQHWFYRHLIRSTLKPIEIVRIIGICFSQRDLKKLFLPSSSHTFKTGSLLFTTVKYNLKKVVPLATSCFFLPWEPKKLTRKNHESTRKLIFVGLSAWLKNLLKKRLPCFTDAKWEIPPRQAFVKKKWRKIDQRERVNGNTVKIS